MSGQIRKILIANRGEIAVRIIRTCRKMGISSVAVYSDADACALHAAAADEAVRIGPAPGRDSYLNIDRVLAAARRTGADAIHPGYGFLAENADFAQSCGAAGIDFIGPSADAIRLMGSKKTAREIVARAGVPIVPGYDGDDQSLGTLREQARRIGFPVLVKAALGGGGKGMRVLGDEGSIEDALASARREAEKSFGDGTLLLEKLIDRARHVEFQILGDRHGHLLHLGERDCSIQRRHQKVIEESPSPALNAELRARMGEAAIAAGQALHYDNAGTVEFILDQEGQFYFIEVNTRLQVEHPVTEMLTGLDLVRLQIEIASGQPLSLPATGIERRGHAIEARLYAEDPDRDFLPSSGRIIDWREPEGMAGLRIDTAVGRGTEIGIHYDPLLAKLIAHGKDRQTASRQLALALRHLSVAGLRTNREFLIRVLEAPAFLEGEAHTGFISEHASELISVAEPEIDRECAIVAAVFLQQFWQATSQAPPGIPFSYRNNPYRDPWVRLSVGAAEYTIAMRFLGDNLWAVTVEGREFAVRLFEFEAGGESAPGQVRLAIDDLQRIYRVAAAGESYWVSSILGAREVIRLPRYPQPTETAEGETTNAPMPGQVLKILVEVGERVEAGAPLLILEAMKMEQLIRAALEGTVEAVLVKPGDIVGPGDVLIEIR